MVLVRKSTQDYDRHLCSSAGYYDAYYLKAQKVRRLIKDDFDTVFQSVDALLTPATPTVAFPVGRKIEDPVTNYLNDVFTVPANLAGLPGISVPGGLTSDGLPLGLQVVGRPFDEAAIYRVAAFSKMRQVLSDASSVGIWRCSMSDLVREDR